MMDDCQCRQQKNTNYVMKTEGQDGLFSKVRRMLVLCKCVICYDIDLVTLY